MGESIEYPDVLQEVRGAMNPGRLKLQSGNVIFKNIKTGIVEQFPASDIERATWLMRARGYCLKFSLTNGQIHRYDGFRESEYEKLSAFVKKNYETSLDKVDLALKGWNWGNALFKGNSLDFRVGHHTAFEIPLGNVSHSVTNKSEVTLEFHQNDDAAISLTEIRFHIPPGSNPEADPVDEFHKNIMSKADVILATGDAITLFSDVQCLTPRGRYDIKMYPTFLQLHGKTFDYKIPYTTILRLFLLPHKDQRQMFFVVSLDPPIKQGQTRYHFLILLFNKEDEATLELALSEDDLEEKYQGKLTQTMSGPEYEMVSRVMKAMVGRKITVPGTFMSKDIEEKYEGKLTKEMSGLEYELISRIMKALVQRKITVPGSFSSHGHNNCIGCSYKAGTGLLYPLERGFIFVHKPAVHVRFDEISSVNFARSSNSLRSFDFEVETKAGTTFTFQAIDKDEYGKLYDFVTNKKLRVKNMGSKMTGGYKDDMLGSDDEGAHDAYLERMKAEGKERDEDDEDDEDSSEDEDFVAPEDSGSEVAEEYDSNVSTSSDSDSDDSASGSDAEARQRKKKEKKEKKEKKKRTRTVREPGMKRKSKKKDKVVDPDKPKRAPTAYFMWFTAARPNLKEEFPDISVTELSKKAGERWRGMTDEKKEWEEKAAVAKAKYDEEMAAYKEKLKNMSPEELEARAVTSPKKKRSKPKAEKSPVKTDTKAGSGINFKSKEFISDSESSPSSSESDDDKPLAKKARKEKAPRRKRKQKEESEKEESGSEPAELPSEEEILSTPPSSGKEDGGSDSGSGSD